MDVIIRNIKLEDLEDIMEIELEAFTTPWSRHAFEMEISGNDLAEYIVAEVGGKVIGYGGVWLIVDEGHITNIAVAKSHQGKGIGDKLIKGLIHVCEDKKIYNITLEVRKTNTVAQNLYIKYGFINCGIRPNYYADDKEDAVIMWRNIR